MLSLWSTITDMHYIIGAFVFLLPGVTLAQSGSLQGMITGLGDLISNFLIPFVLALAFLIFVYNVYRFFILGGSTEDGRENAKYLAIYSVITFTFIIIFGGLINFFGEAIGINNDPCENDMVSDYVISDLAPCTSLRPKPRPYDAPDTTAPGGGFGTGVGAIDEPIIVPGGSSVPTTPSAPTSFTPDGAPISYDSVLAAHNTIRSTAASFFATRANEYYGYNEDIVLPLFADLNTTHTNTVIELDRLKAALRLSELGVISDAQFATYLVAYNSYIQTSGLPYTGPITLAALSQDLTMNPPAALQSRTNQTRQNVIDMLTEYNMQSSYQIDISRTVSDIYNVDTDTETRYDKMLELYYPQPGAPLTITNAAQLQLLKRYIADINTEKIYSGDYYMVQ